VNALSSGAAESVTPKCPTSPLMSCGTQGSAASLAAQILSQQNHHAYAQHNHHVSHVSGGQAPLSNGTHGSHQHHHGGIPRSPDTRCTYDASGSIMWAANASAAHADHHGTNTHAAGPSDTPARAPMSSSPRTMVVSSPKGSVLGPLNHFTLSGFELQASPSGRVKVSFLPFLVCVQHSLSDLVLGRAGSLMFSCTCVWLCYRFFA
jgi:hypothetical protein